MPARLNSLTPHIVGHSYLRGRKGWFRKQLDPISAGLLAVTAIKAGLPKGYYRPGFTAAVWNSEIDDMMRRLSCDDPQLTFHCSRYWSGIQLGIDETGDAVHFYLGPDTTEEELKLAVTRMVQTSDDYYLRFRTIESIKVELSGAEAYSGVDWEILMATLVLTDDKPAILSKLSRLKTDTQLRKELFDNRMDYIARVLALMGMSN